jgi:hypothetical protein
MLAPSCSAKHGRWRRYFLVGDGATVATAGPPGGIAFTGGAAFFCFFGSLLPRCPLDMIVSDGWIGWSGAAGPRLDV